MSVGSGISKKSGRGQPHSKTLSRRIARPSFREVLECGCPLPLCINSPVAGCFSREGYE
jgi:hypothetical protein